MSEFLIRSIKKEEIPLLERFLYLAIFVPENSDPPPYSIIYNKELQVYIEDLGERKDDHILVADVDGKIVGGAWVRIMDDYGHLDDETPSLIISVEKEYRGKGIGKSLLESMISLLRTKGYKSLSLSCQKDNYALLLYKALGFITEKENIEEVIMRKKLQ